MRAGWTLGAAAACLLIAACGGSSSPRTLSRFARNGQARLAARAIAPGADVICVLEPYQEEVTGPGADPVNKYIAAQHLGLTDEGSWMLLWSKDGYVHHRKMSRRPLDLLRWDAAARHSVPSDLRYTECARGGDGVFIKVHTIIGTGVLLAEAVR